MLLVDTFVPEPLSFTASSCIGLSFAFLAAAGSPCGLRLRLRLRLRLDPLAERVAAVLGEVGPLRQAGDGVVHRKLRRIFSRRR